MVRLVFHGLAYRLGEIDAGEEICPTYKSGQIFPGRPTSLGVQQSAQMKHETNNQEGYKEMTTHDVFLTEDGRQHALAQLAFLRTEKRAEVAQYLQEAKEAGDVIDNAAYEDARDAQVRLENRILELEQLLSTAKTIHPVSTREVSLGSVIQVRTADNRDIHYTLVGTYEARPAAGLISNESPVGKAFLGRKVGDVITVSTPGGVKVYTIHSIT